MEKRTCQTCWHRVTGVDLEQSQEYKYCGNDSTRLLNRTDCLEWKSEKITLNQVNKAILKVIKG